MALFQSIIKAFEKIGLPLKVMTEPIRGVRVRIRAGMEKAASQIFQMDIERLRGSGMSRTERFRIYPGNPNNLIQVRDTDAKARQLLLMVKEDPNEFEDETRITKYSKEADIRENLKRQKAYGIKKVGDKIIYKMKTPAGTRYFLMGFDERQLFIAQLQRAATTVPDARKSLGRTATIMFADGKVRGTLDRQGEWFLIETSQETRNYIEKLVKETKTVIQNKINIGSKLGRPGGNPHIADELVVIPNKIEDKTSRFRTGPSRPIFRSRVFIRGCVRHIDHPTQRFSNWREVIPNDEGATGTATSSGIFYID